MRRRHLLLAAPALATPALLMAPGLRAQTPWPDRPLRFIVPFPPGGSTDVLSRVLAERLAAALGQPVIIENRPGAAGNVGVEAIARARPDGYTIGNATIGTLTSHIALYPNLPFNPRTDFTYLADLYEIPNVFVVNPKSGIASVAEFIARAKARPGELTFGTPGNGTTGHLGTEFFSTQAGIKLTHVPYRTGATAVQDLIAGRIDMMFDNLPTIIGQISGGQITALAVSTATRWPGLPNVPTMAEAAVPGFDVTSWSGLLAPKGVPDAIAQRLIDETVKIGADPAFQERWRGMGALATMKGPDVLRARVEREIPRWAEVVRASGAKLE
jgi:tripartite-type tricarboxylate transporter receptor subunit TctC